MGLEPVIDHSTAPEAQAAHTHARQRLLSAFVVQQRVSPSPSIVGYRVHLSPRLQQITRDDREAHRGRPVQRGIVEKVPLLHVAARLYVEPHSFQVAGLWKTAATAKVSLASPMFLVYRYICARHTVVVKHIYAGTSTLDVCGCYECTDAGAKRKQGEKHEMRAVWAAVFAHGPRKDSACTRWII